VNNKYLYLSGKQLVGQGGSKKAGMLTAIIVTCPAGNTTAIVSGKNRGTGVALVEVYYLPL